MKHLAKQLLAYLLIAAMMLSLLPFAVSAEEGGDRSASDALWAQITALEDKTVVAKRGTQATAADYAALSGEVAALVTSSAYYEEGTCTYDGENTFFFWETTDGEVCGYSPRLRSRIRTADGNAAEGSVETVSYAKKGGSPDSVEVAVFQPYYGIDSSFSTRYKNEGASIAEATGGTSTTYLTTGATIDAIADAMETCGVVIFDSHGTTDYENYMGYTDRYGDYVYDYSSQANSSYICLQSKTGITTADKAAVTGPYGTYYHYFNGGSYGKMYYYCVDGTAIANHMEQDAPHSLLWMAICLGMATDGLQAPLREKGVEVVYGYSQSVTFTYDYKWEATFFDKLCSDSTVAEAAAAMKEADGYWDDNTTYKTVADAQKYFAAFPIVVSSEDVYPGHGKVDNLQTVNSTWKLKPEEAPVYTLSAVPNDSKLGTVSVEGKVVTATPAESAYVAGYTLTPENGATVTQEGNVFRVTDMTADCLLTVNFAAIPRLSAASNDETLGTVSVEGNVVTATSAEGAYVAGYTLTPENAATVTQEGNVFRVTDMTADCVLTVNFAAKTPATVHYLVPDGCTKADSTGYVGESIVLSAPEGKPSADAYDYTFFGWTDAPVSDMKWMPIVYTDYYTPMQEKTTLYALYWYIDAKNALHYTTELQSIVYYNLSAVSNDEKLGMVSVEDNVVTAMPAEGAYIADYTLTPENGATVTQEGNVFRVTDMTADCLLTVNFAAIPRLSAASNDETLGTVSVEGNVVTATSAEGAYVAGYTLTPENAATVTQEGNVFRVTDMTADCVLTVNFAAKTPATVHYLVPDGCTKADSTGYVGESIVLSAPEGKPSADAYDYTFFGWTDAPVSDMKWMPIVYTDYYTPMQEKTTLYALYWYIDAKNALHYTTELQSIVYYNLSAVSNDEKLGMVSVEDNVVTAMPAEGAYIADYTLTPENGATVTQEGNVFRVTDMTADCLLTVRFAAKTAAKVTYSVPEGCEKAADSGYVGDALKLTPPTGAPTADAQAYTFVGWTVDKLEDGADAPIYFTDTFNPTKEEMTLYALYTYEKDGVRYYTTVLRSRECYLLRYADADAGAWYHEAIDFAVGGGYMNGVADDRVDPAGTLTRAMLVTILYRMSGETGGTHPFTDVPANEWYADAVAWAYTSGVVNGTSATRFSPEAPVTREQTAAMLYRYAKYMGQGITASGNLSVFRDADQISEYAKVPMRWAVGMHILNGKENATLDPTGTATRAEIAQILLNLSKAIPA